MTKVESFIVRVYRRSNKKAFSVAGIVEKVGRDEKQGFEDGNELLTILSGIKDQERQAVKEKNG